MNFLEYEKQYFYLYQDLADTVRFILEQSLQTDDQLPQPQAIKCRAKGIDSLRRRLVEADKLDSQTLEADRRDLAGARLIFYTDDDVNRFVKSSVINDNFLIEKDSAKVHHPTQENNQRRYRAIHYTVQLRDDRIHLPEYARFAGRRCEIQIQTILHHAWSETEHDVIYKDNFPNGYGSRAMDVIKRRFERIMDDYLLPAGYEIQKAQRDYELLARGREVFDRNIADLLANAGNNNERYEILTRIKDDVLPYVDDAAATYDGLRTALLEVAKAARRTDPVGIDTTFGEMAGYTAQQVTEQAIEIIEWGRYLDPAATLQALIQFYLDDPDEDVRKKIIKVVEELAGYNLDVYQHHGLSLQAQLLDQLAHLPADRIDAIRPIALAVWTQALQPDVKGMSWSADTVTYRSAAVPASADLAMLREKAMGALFAAFDRSTSDQERRDVLAALDYAKRTPMRGGYSNALQALTLVDMRRIVDHTTECAATLTFELLQHVEHGFLWDYRRTEGLSHDPDNRFNCRAEATALRASIESFRDKINADPQFVRYKVLVGFESVFPGHWTDSEFEITGADAYRRDQASEFVRTIEDGNEAVWLDFVVRCAATKSNDMATFPAFCAFLEMLAKDKPGIAERWLANASDDLHQFMPHFLNGLSSSEHPAVYEAVFARELESARSLRDLAWHLRYAAIERPVFAASVLRGAIAEGDTWAVSECLAFGVECFGTPKISDADGYIRDALAFLNERRVTRWVTYLRLPQAGVRFYDELTLERAIQLLQVLGHVRSVDFRVEAMLAHVAERYLEIVWDYFGARLQQGDSDAQDTDRRYEAVPFRLNSLGNVLAQDPNLAIRKGLEWFDEDRELFQYRGGRLLSAVLPYCPEDGTPALAELVRGGGDREAEFALEILQNYEGKASTHAVLKEIVAKFHNDERKMVHVQISIDNTGVVAGELGFAEAWRFRRHALTEWLGDDRPAVKVFAEAHIKRLEAMIAAEQRHAETETEMRRRSYDPQG